MSVLFQPPPLRNELTIERLASIHPIRPRYDALRKEAGELETQIKQLTDALDTLLRMQQRWAKTKDITLIYEWLHIILIFIAFICNFSLQENLRISYLHTKTSGVVILL